MTTVDEIPVAFTPAGGWTEVPAPVLAGCTDPLVEGAPDLRGWWQTEEVFVDGEHMMWQYLGYTARLKRLGPPDVNPEVD